MVVVAGCLEPQLVPCGEIACPSDTTCIAGACASAADVEACTGVDEGAPCDTRVDGFCRGGACASAVCGDGILTSNEVCDDGDRDAGDGCASDCRSDETCGNQIVDYARGEQCDSGVRGLAGDGCSSTCLAEYDSWLPVTPVPIGARMQHAMAYTPANDHLVVFGGTSASGLAGETWELVGNTWHPSDPVTSPPARSEHAMATAPHGDAMMFGGVVADGSYSDETWLWDGTNWNDASSAGPSPRAATALAYDSMRDRVVLFGGEVSTNSHIGDTWVWQNGAWQELHSTENPTPRGGQAMAYDPVRDRVVLFGGYANNTHQADTWELDGSQWVRKVATGPAGRSAHSLTYDPGRERIVMFGGTAGLQAQNDTWEWNGAQWTAVSDPTPPPTRLGAAVAFAPTKGIVLHGGGRFSGSLTYLGDTWQYAAGDWTAFALETTPGGRRVGDFVFDAGRGVGVLIGGTRRVGDVQTVLNDTWEWDGIAWSKEPDQVQPRSPHAVYDEARRVIVAIEASETWTHDGTWTKLTVANTPASFGSAIAYDRDRQRVVVVDSTAATYEWDGVAWTQIAIDGPPATSAHRLVYDTAHRVVARYDGTSMWTYDGTAWTDVTPATMPPFRKDEVFVYDPVRSKAILFGGHAASLLFGDTWEWDGATWLPRSPLLSPSRRFAGTAIFDGVHDTIVLSGGEQAVQLDETWTYQFQNTGSRRDVCRIATIDSDGDELLGCADPDCWGRCTPLCPPGTSCDPALPRCGDGACSPTEDYLICPDDC